MPRPRNTVPRFCTDKTGRAFTKVDGRFITLGRADDPQARLKYAGLLADLANGKDVAAAQKPAPKTQDVMTVAELCLRYATQEVPRYSRAERHCFLTAIRVLRELFGAVAVVDFGPLMLRLVRDAMIAGDPNARDGEGKPRPRKPWARRTVNGQVKRLRAVFRWGVSWELCPQPVADALGSLRSLTIGETTARESTPRMAVPQADIEAVRAQLRQKHRDIFDLLLMTGARPAEIIDLRSGDIDRTGEIWRCEIVRHKTARHGKRRTLYFTPKAQLILRRYITPDPTARLFKQRRDNFGHTIKRACIRAGVAPFVPHQLRHTVATKLTDEIGIEATQRLLGHADAAMTEHYSRAAERAAVDAVRKLG